MTKFVTEIQYVSTTVTTVAYRPKVPSSNGVMPKKLQRSSKTERRLFQSSTCSSTWNMPHCPTLSEIICVQE